MRLERRHAWFLIGVAVWNVVTYANFAKNLAGAEGWSTMYYVVHTALIVVNLAIAAVLGRLGYRAYKATRRPAADSPRVDASVGEAPADDAAGRQRR